MLCGDEYSRIRLPPETIVAAFLASPKSISRQSRTLSTSGHTGFIGILTAGICWMSRTPSTDLFELIRTLSKQEKRLFKVHAARHAIGGRNKYVRLFDAIDRQHDYDEAKLVAVNTWLRAADLPGMKAYLYDMILRSLREAGRERNTVAQVQYQIDKADILMQRGLYAQAARLLARAGEHARKGSHLVKELEILFAEASLKVRSPRTNTLERHQEIHERQLEVLGRLTENIEYYNLFMRTYYLQMSMLVPRSDADRDRVREILASPLLASDRVPRTSFARMQYYEIRGRCCQILGDIRGEFDNARQKVACLEQNAALMATHQYEYIYAMGTVLFYCARFRNYREFDESIAKLRAFEVKAEAHEVDRMLVEYYSVFGCLVQRCKFDEALAMIPSIENFLESHAREIEISSVHEFRIKFLMLCVKTARFADARNWLSVLMNDRGFHAYGRYMDITRLLGVIVNFELGDERTLESSIRALYRQLQSKGDIHSVESTVALFLRRLAAMTSRRELVAAFRELHGVLEEFRSRTDGSMLLERFDLLSWLESKIRNVPFAEVLREKECR